MTSKFAVSSVVIFLLMLCGSATAMQQPPTQAGLNEEVERVSTGSQDRAGSVGVPRVVRFGGVIREVDGTPRTGITGVVFSLYKDKEGGAPLWMEVQNVQLSATGTYAVLLGSASPDGVPAELFSSNEIRWLGIQPEGQEEGDRVMLVSVPYALKAGDAETLGGKPASAFVQAPQGNPREATGSQNQGETEGQAQALPPGGEPALVDGTGTTNNLAKWTSSTVIGNAANLVELNGNLGLGTTVPVARMHLRDGVTRMLFEQIGPPARNWVLGTDNSPDSFFLFDQTAGATRWVIDSAGNMGVGTQTPTSRFHITGPVARMNFEQTEAAPRNWTLGTDNSPDSFFLRDNTAGATRLAVDPSGNVGIGTSTPQFLLHVVNTTSSPNLRLETELNNDSIPGLLTFQENVGATTLCGFQFKYLSQSNVLALEGGCPTPIEVLRTNRSNGAIGIGGLPTAGGLLTVHSDIRIGTGTTGCVTDIDGTTIAGTCSSDLRFKRDVRAFPKTLEKLVQLQPVSFSWRAEEFPDRGFGTAESFGLIAQQVEEVLPELVTEDAQGYRAVRYHKLPLLLLEAIRELKAQNDELRARVEQLEHRANGQSVASREWTAVAAAAE